MDNLQEHLNAMSFEKLFILHCAPVLAGLKPSSLFAVQKGRDEARRKAFALKKECERLGVGIAAIDGSKKAALFFVYNRALLLRTLRAPERAAFLAKMGYPAGSSAERAVSLLCERLEMSAGGFPHEAGVFLGYPLEDVEGFIANGGRGYKMCGYWKVYGNEARAKALFKMYSECRRFCTLKAEAGYSLPELCSACKFQYREALL